MSADPIVILRAGAALDTAGSRHVFAQAHLAELAASYDPTDPAPLVLGTPRHDDPAYGWIDALTVQGDRLVATASHVAPAFDAALRQRAPGKLHTPLYPPGTPSNGTPGRWRLRHVALMGTKLPGAQRAGSVAFASAATGLTVEVDRDAASGFTPTPGYGELGSHAVLHRRAGHLQAVNPSLSYWDAVTAARQEAAMTSLADAVTDPARRHHARIAAHAAILKATTPGMTNDVAIDRARRTLSIPQR